MLNLDCIKEIAYWCNYKTTKIMIRLYPSLYNENFWKSKCQRNFPEQNYLDFYSGEENYLLRKKDDFILLISRNGYNYTCEDVLFEHSKMLDKMIKMSAEKIDGDQRYHDVHILLQCQFVVIFLLDVPKIIKQCNLYNEAIEVIKNNCKNPFDEFMIIDMESITPYFTKYGNLTETTEPFYFNKCYDDFV